MAGCRWGQRAKDLLVELQRSDWLPSYNEEGVRKVVGEVNALYEEIKGTIQAEGYKPGDPYFEMSVIVHHKALLRNKRCILAYLHHRLEVIKKLRWETGSVLPAHAKKCLSPQETDFFTAYDKLHGDYASFLQMDLTADLQPPKDLYIEVRVEKDCGEIFTDSGAVTLERGTTHYLRRSDVEHLIRQGFLRAL